MNKGLRTALLIGYLVIQAGVLIANLNYASDIKAGTVTNEAAGSFLTDVAMWQFVALILIGIYLYESYRGR